MHVPVLVIDVRCIALELLQQPRDHLVLALILAGVDQRGATVLIQSTRVGTEGGRLASNDAELHEDTPRR